VHKTRVPAIDLSRSRDLGDILGGAFSLHWRYFGLFAGIAFAVVGPIGLLAHTLAGQVPRNVEASLGLTLWLVTVPLVTAGHVNAVTTLGTRRDVFVGDALKAAARRLPALVVTLVLLIVATVIGLVLLIIPGIFVATRLYVSAQAVAAEGIGPVDGLGRSEELVDGNGWRVLGTAILIWLIAAALAGLVSAPFAIAAAAVDSGAIGLVGLLVSNGFSLSFAALAGTLLYFDLRARHDGAPHDLDAPERPY
jgi:hypothetical protein